MDLLQLEHFLAVVEEGTFTRAAERVCRTQPAVSQSIKKLEDESARRSSPATSTRFADRSRADARGVRATMVGLATRRCGRSPS